MIAHLKRLGATVLFNSNAITLGPRFGGELVDTGLDELRVSLDVHDPGDLRAGPGRQRLREGRGKRRAVRRGQARCGRSTPACLALVHGLRDNIEEIAGLVALARRVAPAGSTCSASSTTVSGSRRRRSPCTDDYRSGRQGDPGDGAGRPRGRVSSSPRRAPRRPRSASPRRTTTGRGVVPAAVEPRLRHRARQCAPCCIAPWITGHYEGIVLGTPAVAGRDLVGRAYLDFRTAIQTDVPPEPCSRLRREVEL